jgi:hypothetical protein
MTSTSFGSKKRPAGKQWRSKPAKQVLDNVFQNVEAAFVSLEAAVGAGYAPVKSASTANVANLASFTVANDSVTLVEGDRVLLKDQSTATQNGIYVVGVVATGTAPLTRATDMAAGSTFTDGDAVWCQQGTANGNKEFRLTTTGLVGTDAIVYVTLTSSISAGSITATELASDSVVTAKILNANVTNAKLAAGAVSVSKLAGEAGAGTPTARAMFGEFIDVPDGATGTVTSVTVPVNCVLGSVIGVKTDDTGATLDSLQIRTATGGGGSAVSTFALDSLTSGSPLLDFPMAAFAANAVVYIHRVADGAGNNAAKVQLIFVPVT